MLNYQVGDGFVLTGTFYDIDGALADPTDVVMKVKDPAGTITELTPTNTSVGVYTGEFEATISGTYYWRIAGTGAVKAADEGSVGIDVSVFA